MKKRISLLMGCLLLLGHLAIGQNLQTLEYFFGDDPGIGNGTLISLNQSGSQSLVQAIQVPFTNPGYYSISVRIFNGTSWSQVIKRPIIVEANDSQISLSKLKVTNSGMPLGSLSLSGNGTYVQSSSSLNTNSKNKLEYKLTNSEGVPSHYISRPLFVEREPSSLELSHFCGFFGNDTVVYPKRNVNLSGTDFSGSIVNQTDTIGFGGYAYHAMLYNKAGVPSHYLLDSLSICSNYGPFLGAETDVLANRFVKLRSTSSNLDSLRFVFPNGDVSTDSLSYYQFTSAGNYLVNLVAYNECAIDTLPLTLDLLGINKVRPAKLYQTQATLSISGYGFTEQDEYYLVQGTDTIRSLNLRLVNDELVSMGVDAQGKSGFYSLHWARTNSVFVLNDAVEVLNQDLPALNVNATLLGRQKILRQVDYPYELYFRNDGARDVLGTQIVLENLPNEAVATCQTISDSSLADPIFQDLLARLPGGDQHEFFDFQLNDTLQPRNKVLIFAPGISAGERIRVPIELRFSELERNLLKLSMSPNEMMAQESRYDSLPRSQSLKRYSEFRILLLDSLGFYAPDSVWNPAFNWAQSFELKWIQSRMNQGLTSDLLPLKAVNAALIYRLNDTLGLNLTDSVLNQLVLGSVLWTEIHQHPIRPEFDSLMTDFFSVNPQLAIYGGASLGGQRSIAAINAELCTSCDDRDLLIVAALDPNEKYGPGVGSAGYTKALDAFDYQIAFENVDTALADVSTVTILDSLDTSVFNFSKFHWTSFGLSDTVFPLITEALNINFVFDYEPKRSLKIGVEGSLDTLSGLLQFKITALDPSNLKPLNDPDLGLLSPNIVSPEGEGYLNFAIGLKPNIGNADIVRNKALIIFDANEPIVTNTALSTIDEEKPFARVLAYADTVYNNQFEVKVEAIDSISGIFDVELVEVKIQGLDTVYNDIANLGTDTSFTFEGDFGNWYHFYAIGTDSAQNQQSTELRIDWSVYVEESCHVEFTLTDSIQNIHCAGDSSGSIDLFVSNLFPPFSYSWSTGDTVSNLSNLSAGQYVVEVTNARGCLLTDTFNLSELNQPKAVFDTLVICSTDSAFLQGNWQTGAGDFVDSLQTLANCDSLIYTNLQVLPVFNTQESASVCEGDSMFLGGAWQLGSGTFFDTLQTASLCDSVIETTLSIDPIDSVNYSATICEGDSLQINGMWATAAGVYTYSVPGTPCDSVILFELLHYDTPQATTIIGESQYCFNDGEITLTTLNGQGGTINWVNLNSGQTVATGQDYSFSPNPGAYHFAAYAIGDCAGPADSIMFNVYANPVLTLEEQELSLLLGESVLLNAMGSDYLTVEWSNAGTLDDPTLLTPLASPSQTTMYTLTLTGLGDCVSMDSILVKVLNAADLEISNFISPNGDGFNDFWNINNPEALSSCSFSVFDSWGNVVYQSTGYQTPWDGTLQGTELSDGNYFYQIICGEISHTGGITLKKD